MKDPTVIISSKIRPNPHFWLKKTESVPSTDSIGSTLSTMLKTGTLTTGGFY